MASYRIEWKRSAEKDVRKIGPLRIPAIVQVAESLADEPFPMGCRFFALPEWTRLDDSQRRFGPVAASCHAVVSNEGGSLGEDGSPNPAAY